MTIRVILVIIILIGVILFFHANGNSQKNENPEIDSVWWNTLSDEWKNIFLINQNFSKQGINIFQLQDEFMNRLNKSGEENYSEMNRSLYDLHHDRIFNTGYADLYARAIRKGYLTENKIIDLATLGELDTLYMVNGPADLSPLKKFIHLKVLVLNYCGVNNNIPFSKQQLNIDPLKNLKELKVLHCVSCPLTSTEAFKNLTNLEELRCENATVTSLSFLKKLKLLKKLSFGSAVNDASGVSSLENLEELSMSGCKKVPDLSRLKKLKSLEIREGEMAIVNAAYRITAIDFLKDLQNLGYLDFSSTSYKGSLAVLYNLSNLKAVTLPQAGRTYVDEFRKIKPTCKIINHYE